MSLEITSNSINIHNPTGALKFTSSSKLLYETAYATGTRSITSSDISISFDAPASNSFNIFTIKITACTTNDIDDLLGLIIPINANIQTGLHTNAHTRDAFTPAKAQASSLWLSAAQVGGTVVFKQDHSNSLFSTTPTMPTISFTYYFRTYSYL